MFENVHAYVRDAELNLNFLLGKASAVYILGRV